MGRGTEPRLPAAPVSGRQVARRVRILRAASDVAARDGLAGVQMQDVAKEAGVALGTLYRYFPSKPYLFTAVFECKASRADFLRDSAPEAGAAELLVRLSERLMALRALIGGHRPDLRQREELFPEWDAVDLRGLRHETHDRLQAEYQAAQRKLHEGTKFAKLARWRAANLLYVVAEPGLFQPHELPDGWGLLERRGAGLELAVKPCLWATTAEERVALVERIAAVAAARERRVLGDAAGEPARVSSARRTPSA